ncbi:NACHT domain-containing protein [Escherichia coli]|uniref:NACHT domain-containing protein n=1 Tax=Escherichia coli TaxID=562 RepID=UPI003993679E
MKTGHYHNADILPLNNEVNVNQTFEEYRQLGYACQIKKYQSYEEAHKELFNGFFSVDSTKERLIKDYNTFTDSIVKIHSPTATYSYINSKYYLNGVIGEANVVTEILERIQHRRPILFLIEAAAGFGKTCTAYELLREIIVNNIGKIPLFSELSRNRQAKIFRYVLLDEIDRSFPLLSSALVRNEIRAGNVPVILDGFDELLHESTNGIENNYEKTEPMLETISELLTDSAKVVLTTRRTAIFDGDEFHQWIASHQEDFDVIRIRIHEPQIEDWLPGQRLDEISSTGFPLNKLSNPVLLSFLRCIDDTDFNKVISDPTTIVRKYFDSMLERERKRQDLLMSIEDQYTILKIIADDMVEGNYTSESREYISLVITEKNQQLLEATRKLYTVDERPTTDELVNKLASHALLDRSGSENQGIGFVNEFVLGNFVSENIINDKSNEWIGDKRFIEPAVQSYMPRIDDEKELLWHSLEFALYFMSGNDKILYSHLLIGKVPLDLKNDSVEQLSISKLSLGDINIIHDTIFVDCSFFSSIFTCGNYKNVTFVNCSFIDCSFNELSGREDIYFLGCECDNDAINKKSVEINSENDHDITDCDIYILEKFCPRGSVSYHKHRPIKGLCSNNNQFQLSEILHSLDKLRKDGLLLTPDKRSFLELNMARISEIKAILGRNF